MATKRPAADDGIVAQAFARRARLQQYGSLLTEAQQEQLMMSASHEEYMRLVENINKEREEDDRKTNEKIYKENEQAFLHKLEKEEKAKEAIFLNIIF